MLSDSIVMLEGGAFQNLTINSGASYPSSPAAGELFFNTTLNALAVHNGTTWVVLGSGAVTSVNGQTGVVTISTITGNAGTATALATARNIALTGDVTGTASFNGSADASIAATLKGDVVVSKTFNGAVSVNYSTEGSYVIGTVTGDTTLTITGVPDTARAYGMTFELTNPGTNITWPASVSWLGTAPTLRASGVSMVTLVTRNGGTTWLGTAA